MAFCQIYGKASCKCFISQGMADNASYNITEWPYVCWQNLL